jgi:hypothetical protein
LQGLIEQLDDGIAILVSETLVAFDFVLVPGRTPMTNGGQRI